MQRSKSRLGLDALLAQHPNAEVARILHQDERVVQALAVTRASEIFPLPMPEPGPWTTVDLLEDAKGILAFSIWNYTGNVYEVDVHGAAADDPIIAVTEATHAD